MSPVGSVWFEPTPRILGLPYFSDTTPRLSPPMI
jgi:hypothetical protein